MRDALQCIMTSPVPVILLAVPGLNKKPDLLYTKNKVNAIVITRFVTYWMSQPNTTVLQ